jgi:hypothetical protein
VLLDPAHRARLRDNDREAEASRNRHAEQLKRNEYRQAVDDLQREGLMSAGGAEEFRKAFEEDLRLQSASDTFPGPGGFLIGFIVLAEQRVLRSELASRALDRAKGGTPLP